MAVTSEVHSETDSDGPTYDCLEFRETDIRGLIAWNWELQETQTVV